MRRLLAWQSILDDRESLDLPPHQVRQAQTQLDSSEGTVTGRIGETYQWLLAPKQGTPQSPVEWDVIRLTAQGPLAERASTRMRSDESLLAGFAGTRLRMELDRVPLWQGDHASVRQLSEYFASYPYLPRLQGSKVLLEAIRQGIALLTWEQDTFAYADSYDDSAKRYLGLQVMTQVSLLEGDSGLIVRPNVARRQLDAEAASQTREREKGQTYTSGTGSLGGIHDTSGTQESTPLATRYHGSVRLDPMRVGVDAGQIADEVIAHLSGLMGAEVRLTLEIEANIPDGASDHVVRTVTENSRQLKFDDSGFERE